MSKFDIKKQIRNEFRAAVPPRAPKLDLEELLPQRPKQNPRLSFQRITAVSLLFLTVLLSGLFTGWIPSAWTTTTTTNTITTDTTSTTTTDSDTTSTTATNSGTTSTTTINPDTTSSTTTIPTTDTTTTTTTNPIVLPVAETTLANPLITAANLAFSMGSSTTRLSFRLADPILLVDRHLDWIHRYVGALETMLAQTDGYPAEVVASDREGFTHRLRASSQTLSGMDLEFNLYYNIVNAKDDQYDLVGLVVRDGVESPFEGTLKTDADGTKWSIRSFYSEPSLDDYVETTMKLEEDTQKIETRIYEGGILIHASLIKTVMEANEAKIVVETTSADESIVFDVKWEVEDGISKLKGSYRIDGVDADEQGRFTIELIVDPSDQNTYYRYTIKSGDTTKIVDKNRAMTDFKRTEFTLTL